MIVKENFIFNSTKEFRYISGIYKISQNIDNRIYIGSAKRFWNRFCRHISKLKEGKHCNFYLQNFHNKHPEAIFTFDLIEFVPDLNKLVEREQFWLDETKCYENDFGFNICQIAYSCLGRIMTEEARRKISGWNSVHWGKKLSEERKRICSESNKGNQNWRFKKPYSDKAKEKMLTANRIPIVLISKEGVFLREFHSTTQAAKELNITGNRGNISAVCRGARKTVKGYYFQYKSKYLEQHKDTVLNYLPPISFPLL